MDFTAIAIEFGVTCAKLGFVLFFILNFAGLLTWAERRQSAMMQDRLGCNRAYITVPFLNRDITLFGLLFPAADGLKMFLKEDWQPAGADVAVHTISPLLAWFPPFVCMAFIPFGGTVLLGGHAVNLIVSEVNLGMLAVFAFTSLGIFGVFLAGWSSNNKWALLGGLRASSQMISYEVTMGLTIIGVMMLHETLRLDVIASNQVNDALLFGVLPPWGIFYQPLGALLFLTASIAESKRPPFDLPEADSELVAGYFTEYSGMKFGMFFMAEFAQMTVIGCLMTAIFFGGHGIPWVTDAALASGLARLTGAAADATITQALLMLVQVGVFTLKVIFFCWFQLAIRWTFPRFRYDQIMRLGWKMMLPLSLANIFLTGLVLLWIG